MPIILTCMIVQSLQLEVSYRISWRRDYIFADLYCDDEVINQGHLVSGQGELTCQSGCSGTITSMSYMCTIGGCRAQKEPGHGGLSSYNTIILWLKFNSLSHFFLSWQQGLPGHSPGMPWPVATYDVH